MWANGTLFYSSTGGAPSAANVLAVANIDATAQSALAASVQSMAVYKGSSISSTPSASPKSSKPNSGLVATAAATTATAG
jgi:hypothetical protein